MYLTVTVDTEEDNWGEFTRPSYTVENLRMIPRLQDLCARYGVTPTYLIAHSVATSDVGVKILGQYREQGACEIGAHPHPYNTPPFEEERTEVNSYLCNLPPALQFRKIETLTSVIESAFGVRPTAFRSGRWGFDDSVAGHLLRLGYTVDTSIFPVWDWRPGPDFRSYSHEPFMYASALDTEPSRTLLEVPATVDFLQSNRSVAMAVFNAVGAVPLGSKVLGAMKRMHMLHRVCLSPEVTNTRDMIRLAKTLVARGTRVVNLFFHSPTLLEGRTPFTRTAADVEAFIARTESFFSFAVSEGFTPVALSSLTASEVGATRTRPVAPPSGRT